VTCDSLPIQRRCSLANSGDGRPEPLTAEIAVKDGTGENAVAKAVVKGLKEQLPENSYHVERDDGEDVLIKKRFGEENFDLEIVWNAVKGVRINPDRE